MRIKRLNAIIPIIAAVLLFVLVAGVSGLLPLFIQSLSLFL
jgi:hypothetical protein